MGHVHTQKFICTAIVGRATSYFIFMKQRDFPVEPSILFKHCASFRLSHNSSNVLSCWKSVRRIIFDTEFELVSSGTNYIKYKKPCSRLVDDKNEVKQWKKWENSHFYWFENDWWKFGSCPIHRKLNGSLYLVSIEFLSSPPLSLSLFLYSNHSIKVSQTIW